MPQPLWTAKEAAVYLRLNPAVVRLKARDGEIPGLKIGGAWRFRPEVLEQWVAEGCPVREQQPSLFE